MASTWKDASAKVVPISPLLFVVTVDILLRGLRCLAPDALVRAFADNTAMVVDDLFAHAGAIGAAFREFGVISCMVLNLPKTVVVPLWPQPLDEVREEIDQTLPEWKGIQVASASRYLGFMKALVNATAHGPRLTASSTLVWVYGARRDWASNIQPQPTIHLWSPC